MSQALKRAKSPAARNRFNNIGVTGRKTGVRVAGDVLVDEDGLENVDEFYKQTSPPDKQEQAAIPRPATQTLHTLVSPTPIRSTSNYDTLVGALEMPNASAKRSNSANGNTKSSLNDATVTPPPSRKLALLAEGSPELGVGKQVRSPAKARAGNRRTTLAPSRAAALDDGWVRSPKRGRRVTMAFTQRKLLEELDNSDSNDAVAEAEEPVEGAVEEPAEDAVEEAAIEDPGELTSATVTEANDMVDSRDQSDAEDAHQFIVEEALSDGNLSDQADEELAAAEPAEDDRYDDSEDAAPDGVDEEAPIAYDADNIDEQIEPEAETTTPRKSPGRPKGATSRSKGKGKSKDKQHEEPARRSSRTSVPPLAFWRNEHIEYEYENGAAAGSSRVPKVKNIVRVRQTTEEKAHAKRRRVKRTQLPSLSNIKASELDLNDRGQFFYYDDENYGFSLAEDKQCKFGPKFIAEERRTTRTGKRKAREFDDNDDISPGIVNIPVLDTDGKETEAEAVLSRHDLEWLKSSGQNKQYRMGVGLMHELPDGTTNSSTGVVVLAVGGKKPPRNSDERAMFFLVVSGQIEVQMHSTQFQVGVLGQFMVPPNNSYAIRNVGTHPAQLFFVQVKSPSVGAPAESQDDDSGDDSE